MFFSSCYIQMHLQIKRNPNCIFSWKFMFYIESDVSFLKILIQSFILTNQKIEEVHLQIKRNPNSIFSWHWQWCIFIKNLNRHYIQSFILTKQKIEEVQLRIQKKSQLQLPYFLNLCSIEINASLFLNLLGTTFRALVILTNQKIERYELPAKVIHPKYSKHWPYTVAHRIDCSKMLNHGLNHEIFEYCPRPHNYATTKCK